MDIEFIKEFVTLSQNCNFLETSETMNICQSSLTKHIKKLEEELDIPLFDRTTRSVKLNNYGNTYLPYALQIISLQMQAENEILNLKSKRDMVLNVGFVPMLGQYGIVEDLAEFSQFHPDISLNIMETSNPQDALSSLQCDYVFDAENGIDGNEYNKILFKKDTLAIVLPLDHPLSSKPYLTISDLEDQKFVIHNDVHGKSTTETRNLFHLFHNAGLEPQIVCQVSFTSNMVRMVSKGHGIAAINKSHIPYEIAGIIVKDIQPEIPFYIYAFYKRRLSLTKSFQVFKHYIHSNKFETASE